MHYHGHRKRLRERFCSDPQALQDYEILELLLGYVHLRRDTKPMAKALLARFNSLQGVVDAHPAQYQDIPGVGDSTADFIGILHEFICRHAECKIRERTRLCTPEAVAAMARKRLGRLLHEEIWVAYVDNRSRLIAWEKASRGTSDASLVHPRDIMERALILKATGFILVHNHPSGSARPSGADLSFTQQLQKSSRQLFLRFLDHVIVTDEECYSLVKDDFL